MSWLYRTIRIGKQGRPFSIWKIKTLLEGTDRTSSFAKPEQYTWCGRFLRKVKADELVQGWNVLCGSMALVGPRPMDRKEVDALPELARKTILSVLPGMTSLSSVAFFFEERLLQASGDATRTYYLQIKPLKIHLDCFYAQNRCFLLDVAILWMTFKKVLEALFTPYSELYE